MGQQAGWIFVALLAGSQLYAGYEKKQAGKAQAAELKAKIKQEEMSARDREIQRRQRLLKALGQRSAQLGAQGTTFEGSPSALLVNDFRQYELEKTTDIAQLAAVKNQYSAAARNYQTIGRLGMIGGILGAGAAVAGGPWGKQAPTQSSAAKIGWQAHS